MPHRSPNEILRARARELARPETETPDAGAVLQVIAFRLAHERYAIEHAYVREVVALREMTPLPCVPPFYSGIMSLRGQILPLLDIKAFFDLPLSGITDLHWAIIIHAAGIELGILADAIEGVVPVPVNRIHPSLPTLTGIRAQYLKGVTDEHLVILDAPRICGDERIVVNEEVKV